MMVFYPPEPVINYLMSTSSPGEIYYDQLTGECSYLCQTFIYRFVYLCLQGTSLSPKDGNVPQRTHALLITK